MMLRLLMTYPGRKQVRPKIMMFGPHRPGREAYKNGQAVTECTNPRTWTGAFSVSDAVGSPTSPHPPVAVRRTTWDSSCTNKPSLISLSENDMTNLGYSYYLASHH